MLSTTRWSRGERSRSPTPGILCSQCHNSRLDQTLTRANFNIDTLDSLSREVRDKAIERLMMPDEDVRKMPPARFHTLSDAERDLAIQELMK